ncbi:hypothetical protein PanWU01x14_081380 [Parasponia andersonii]|uniref:Uncharacterized protein n=1 Tax=Parasponia andersonii TaxID=3476 RepID=A0A2P5DB17_PARAD|nr:hypothetical protein PanWU01x14_081380 [Parasponia andersonii]
MAAMKKFENGNKTRHVQKNRMAAARCETDPEAAEKHYAGMEMTQTTISDVPDVELSTIATCHEGPHWGSAQEENTGTKPLKT